jgi:large subunit ribosomal protein L29
MKPSKVREMSDVELENELSNLKSQLFKLRFQSATNQLDNPLQIKSVRKDIARVKTIMRERELKAQNA